MHETPRIFELKSGIDAYNPELSAQDLRFTILSNLEPRLGRLFATRGYEIFQQIAGFPSSDRIMGFGYYLLSNRQYANFYLFTRTRIYWFDFDSNTFDFTPIYFGFPDSADPYVIIPWFDCLYVTKLGAKFVKVQHQTATVVANVPFGRYGIVNNSHVYLGGVGDSTSRNLAQLRWSDLDDPEGWSLTIDGSEADFFNLEPDSRQITGISYQRGNSVVYTENTIWLGSYVGFPGGFRHEPLFPGLGNIFHNAVVRAKDVDYFIGSDNIYALNGFQPIPIGTPIFERFINDVSYGLDISVRGYLDTRKNQVFWIYPSVGHGTWSIVYNYKEDKWSERNPQDVTALFDAPRTALQGYKPINEISTIINNDTDIIEVAGAKTPRIFPQLLGSLFAPTAPVVAKVTDVSRTLIDGSVTAATFETVDFYYENFNDVKEITKVLIEYTGAGTPIVIAKVGVRKNQSLDHTWSANINLVNTDGSLSFFIRKEGVGKFIRFRISVTPTVTGAGVTYDNYVADYRLLSLVRVEKEVPTDAPSQ